MDSFRDPLGLSIFYIEGAPLPLLDSKSFGGSGISPPSAQQSDTGPYVGPQIGQEPSVHDIFVVVVQIYYSFKFWVWLY